MTDKAMSTMSIDSSLDGTERILAQGADGSVILVSGLTSYVISSLTASSVLTPTTGDAVVMERSGTAGTFDLDALSSYVVATGWSVASEANPALTGDMILANRSGTIYELDIDTIQTYVLVGMQATVLDLSGLGAATLAGTDLFAVCQTTTAKKVTLTNLETKLWTDFQAYVAALTAVVTAAGSDSYYVIQSGTPKVVAASDIAAYMDTAIIALGNVQTDTLSGLAEYIGDLSAETSLQDADEVIVNRSDTGYRVSMSTIAQYAMDETFELPWKQIDASKYTALPPSTSTLTMSDTTDINIGDPIKFVWSGTTYYAVVTAVSANALITIAGAPFSTVISISDLYVGMPVQMEVKSFLVESLYADAVYDLLSALGWYERWDGPPAYLVSFVATQGTPDTGAAQPKINVKIDGSLVSTNDSNKGVQISATPGTWTANSNVEISASNYALSKGDSIEIRCTEAGTNGDAADLSINLIFVYE